MKVSIQNLGRIREAEIDVRPLTVFIGPNNTNKSWAAYACFAAWGPRAASWWKHWSTIDLKDLPTWSKAVGIAEEFRPVLGEQLDELNVEVPAEKPLEITDALTGQQIPRVIATEPEPLTECQVSVRLTARPILFSKTRFVIRREEYKPLFKPDEVVTRVRVERLHRHGSTRASYIVRDIEDATNILAKELTILGLVTAQRCDVLPVERLFLFSAPRIADELTDELPLPAQNFIEWTSLARTRPTPPPGVGAPELARLLQQGVFKGRIESPIDGPMRFSTGETSVPVQAAASMVRSLAPLSMWLERIGSPGDTLVIDEPEMNAHPGAQLALAELFALLVNHGFRLILTTHSPYLVEHLSTLMEGYGRPEETREKLAGSFLLKRADAFLDPEKVSVYEFRENQGGPEVEVVDILDREQALIDTTTFAAWTNRMGDMLDEVLSTEEGGS